MKSPSATSRRPSSAARCTNWPIPTTSTSISKTAACWPMPSPIRAPTSATPSPHPLQKPEVLSCSSAANIFTPPAATGGLRVFDIAFIDDKGFSRADHHRPGLAAGPAVFRPHEICHGASPPRPRSPPIRRGSKRPENREQDVNAHLCLSLRHRPLRRPDPRRRRHAARRQPAQQLPRARADVQSRRHPLRQPGDHDRRDLCLYLLRCGLGRRVARRSEASARSLP